MPPQQFKLGEEVFDKEGRLRTVIEVLPGNKIRLSPLRQEELPAVTTFEQEFGTPTVPTQAPGVGEPPPIGTRISRIATPALGATIGGIKGAAMGAPAGPMGAAAGGLAGSIVGAGGGELLQAGFERTGLAGVPPPTARQIGERVAGTTIPAMAGETAGRGLILAGQRLAAPVARKLVPAARESLRIFRSPKGDPLVLPSDVSTSRLLNIFENVADASLLGGGRIEAVRAARQEFAEDQVLGILNNIGPRVTGFAPGVRAAVTRQAGKGFISGLDDAVKAFRATERQLWQETFEPLARDVQVQTPNLDAFLQGSLAQTGREAGEVLPNAGGRVAQRVARLLGEGIQEPGEAALQQLPEVGPGVRAALSAEDVTTMQQALLRAMGAETTEATAEPLTADVFRRTVSGLGKLVRRLSKTVKTDPTKANELGLAKHLLQLAHTDLADSLTPFPEAHTAFQAATTFSRLGNKRLLNETLTKLSDEAPERVVRKLFVAENSTAINAVRDALRDSPKAFEKLQTASMMRVLSPDPTSRKIKWDRVLSRMGAVGDDTLQAMFPRGHAAQVRDLTEMLVDLDRGVAGGTGRVFIQLTQAGAAIGLLTGGFTGSSATIMLAPPVLARIMTSPTGVKWLTTGLTAPPGSDVAVKAANNILAFMVRESEKTQAAPTEFPTLRMVGTPPPTTSATLQAPR